MCVCVCGKSHSCSCNFLRASDLLIARRLLRPNVSAKGRLAAAAILGESKNIDKGFVNPTQRENLSKKFTSLKKIDKNFERYGI